MERAEVIQLIDERDAKFEARIDEKVGTSVAHHFGIMKEWMADQFKLIFEALEVHKDSTDHRFNAVDGKLSIMQKDINDIKLDVCELQNDVKQLKKDVKSIDKRVENIETRQGFNLAHL